MSHQYPNDNARLSDLWIMIQAGNSTTVSTICFLLCDLSKNRDIQTKLSLILSEFMPKHPNFKTNDKNNNNDDDDDDDVIKEDNELLSKIANCEYLNHCIKESMRLWPSCGGSIRDMENDLYYDNMLLPKGSTIIIQHHAIFRADWINNPHQYDPNRWLDTNPQLSKLKEMFTPFGIGKRGCIGQNMAMFQIRIIIAYFICYFEFEFVQEPIFNLFLSMKATSLMMKVHKRM